MASGAAEGHNHSMSTAPTFQIDGGTRSPTLGHQPELYDPAGVAQSVPTPADLDAAAHAFYDEHGYLAVDRLFSVDEVSGALAAIDDLIRGKNEKFNGVYYEAAARRGIEQAEAKDRLDFVRKLAWFTKYDDRLERLSNHPSLTRVVSKLLGGAERGVPTLFQDMALLKPPKIGREKPWHQDHAYFDLDLGERVVGVWIALDEATVANGCMQLLDGGHKLGPIVHFNVRDWQICDTQMLGKRSVAAPLKPGGALFFDGLIPHGTPTNHSPDRRRALQFHYARQDATKVPVEERLKVFGADGRDVTC